MKIYCFLGSSSPSQPPSLVSKPCEAAAEDPALLIHLRQFSSTYALPSWKSVGGDEVKGS